jgi:hypothetical protein
MSTSGPGTAVVTGLRGATPQLALAAGALVGCAYLAFNDPNDPRALMPQCPTKMLTGLDCPLCGGLRMVRSLITGNLSAAVHDNLVLLLCLPVVLVVWGRSVVGGLTGHPRPFSMSRRTGFVVIGVAVCWAVVRNLPGFPLRPGG